MAAENEIHTTYQLACQDCGSIGILSTWLDDDNGLHHHIEGFTSLLGEFALEWKCDRCGSNNVNVELLPG